MFPARRVTAGVTTGTTAGMTGMAGGGANWPWASKVAAHSCPGLPASTWRSPCRVAELATHRTERNNTSNPKEAHWLPPSFLSRCRARAIIRLLTNVTRHDTARKWNFCKSLAGFEMRQGAGALLEWLYLLKSAGRPERAQAPPSWKTIRRKPISPKNFWIASIPPLATFGLRSEPNGA